MTSATVQVGYITVISLNSDKRNRRTQYKTKSKPPTYL